MENAYILALTALARAKRTGGGDGTCNYPPRGGVPLSALADGVQASLGKADSAVQPSELTDYQTKAITDAGEYFVSTTVDGALQELAAALAGADGLVGSGAV